MKSFAFLTVFAWGGADIRGSDLDVYVMTPEVMARDGQKRLVKELRLVGFGQQHASAYDVYQKATLPCGKKLDVQPHHATFVNGGNTKALPGNRFLNNKKDARLCVF